MLAVDWAGFGNAQHIRQLIVGTGMWTVGWCCIRCVMLILNVADNMQASVGEWDSGFLSNVVNSPELIKSRMSVGGYDDMDLLTPDLEWSDDEGEHVLPCRSICPARLIDLTVAPTDLVKSNHAELRTLAPSSPVQTLEDGGGWSPQ